MSILKHHNRKYTTTIPTALGDRYYTQDLVRDFRHSQDIVGQLASDLMGSVPRRITGGLVTKGTGDTLNITVGNGWAKHSVEIPDTFSAFPPSKLSADLSGVPVAWTQQTNMAIASATLNGVATNYVKVRYNELDGNTRLRAKSTGTYAYETVPSYTFVVDTNAPTAYDVCLCTFVGTAGGAFTIGTDYLPHLFALRDHSLSIVSAVDYTIGDTDAPTRYFLSGAGADKTFTLPTLADNQNKIYTLFNNDATYMLTADGEGAETISGMTTVKLPKQGDYITVIGCVDEWKIVSECISSQLVLNGIAGWGSTDTKIPRFTSVVENYGNMFSENHVSGYSSGAKGLELVANRDGVFTLSLYGDQLYQYAGITLNSTQLTTDFASTTLANKRAAWQDVNYSGGASWTGRMKNGDVLRMHGTGSTNPASFFLTMTYGGQ